MKPYALCAYLTLASFSAQAASELIELKYLTPDKAMELAQNSLGEHGSVKLLGNHLLVNATDFRIRELRNLIQQLDQSPKRLLISVDTQDNQAHQAQEHPVKHYSTQNRQGMLQQIQALEGQPAQIVLSLSKPITTTHIDSYGYVQQNTQYQELNQGFYVTARVLGNEAQLAITATYDHQAHNVQDTLEARTTQTHLRAPLGQWVNVSYSTSQATLPDNPYRKSLSTRQSSDSSVRLKVDLIE